MGWKEYPGKRNWLAELRRLVQYRDLLWMLALGELRAKHRQTALGMLWAVFQPLVMMVVFAVVFSSVIGVSMGRVPYVPFAFVGVLCWLLLANSVSAGMSSVVSNMNLLSKANFPREVLPLARLVPPLVDFGVGVAVLVATASVATVSAGPGRGSVNSRKALSARRCRSSDNARPSRSAPTTPTRSTTCRPSSP